jgi:CMP-N,N'-diacetyllegionaminic acid synthase
MINSRSAIAIIPARGGSVGLPGKNLRELWGKPLIAWTIEKAAKSRFLDHILVTTDSEEIADVARRHGAEVPFLRPAELATATALTIDAVQHALGYYRDRLGDEFDYTVLLEPTSPLREDDDIDRMLGALDTNAGRFDSIVSVGEVAEHPSVLKRLDGDAISPFCPELAPTVRRQDNEPAWFPYGVAYMAKTASLLAERTFYTRRCMGFPIRRYQNYEIDSIHDFVCVEAIMRHEWSLA